MTSGIRQLFTFRSTALKVRLSAPPVRLETATQKEALDIILRHLPPLTSSSQALERTLCYSLLDCALPLIYASKPKGVAVTPSWLAIRLGSDSLINLVNSNSGSTKLRKSLATWILRIPGASDRALKTGALPSVFHGKFQSITRDIVKAIESIQPDQQGNMHS